MSRDYWVHWILGIVCGIVWAYGDKAGLPPAMVQLAASVVPGVLAHALNYTPDAASPNVSAPSSGA
jgi:hypothetical protein